MGAHFHRGDAGPGRNGCGQLGLEQIGKGGGVLGRKAVAGPAVHQGAEQGGGLARRGGQMLNQIGGGGFAIGAGDTDQLQLLAGLLPNSGSQGAGPGGQRFGHHQHRIGTCGGIGGGGGGADHRGGGAGCQHLAPEAAAINAAAGQAHEQGSRAKAARITADAADLRIRQPRRNG